MQTIREPQVEKIAQRAYEIWHAEGEPRGREMEHWLRAEREVRLASRTGGGKPRTVRRTGIGATSKNIEWAPW